MNAPQPTRPTLWRTCRAIANHRRLQIVSALIQKPDQTVSAIAEQLHLPMSLASEYLRTLEARGLLSVRRVGRRVKYRPHSESNSGSALIVALRKVFRCEQKPCDIIFKCATAFTHPRRIELFKILFGKPCRIRELRDATRMSARSLARHLQKLELRGFVVREHRVCVTANPDNDFARELARLAAHQ